MWSVSVSEESALRGRCFDERVRVSRQPGERAGHVDQGWDALADARPAPPAHPAHPAPAPSHSHSHVIVRNAAALALPTIGTCGLLTTLCL